MFSNRGSLWVYVFLGFKSRILADFWVYVFFTNFWVCVFFFVFGWREIFCRVCVCVLVGDRFVFLCLADKRDLLLGLCLCSCWRSVCVLCSWICVLVFVFLSSVFWVCVLCSGFVFLLFLDLDLNLGFFKKNLWACDFLFLIFLNLNADVAFF